MGNCCSSSENINNGVKKNREGYNKEPTSTTSSQQQQQLDFAPVLHQINQENGSSLTLADISTEMRNAIEIILKKLNAQNNDQAASTKQLLEIIQSQLGTVKEQTQLQQLADKDDQSHVNNNDAGDEASSPVFNVVSLDHVLELLKTNNTHQEKLAQLEELVEEMKQAQRDDARRAEKAPPRDAKRPAARGKMSAAVKARKE